MIVRRLRIKNFRGIRSLCWNIGGRFVCMVGPGDSTKSTIIDALDFVLGPRWYLPLTDADFFEGNTNRPISIYATVAAVPAALLKDQTFLTFARGFDPRSNTLHEDPEDGKEPVLTIRLTVDESLVARWEVVKRQGKEVKELSPRDRERLSLARLAADGVRELSGRAGIGGAVPGGEAVAGTGPKLWVYTREPVGETLRGGAAGRAWATAHGPASGWATEPGFWNAVRRGWRTGDPRRYHYVTEIPEAAASQFARVKGIGAVRGWKYAGRQYFTRKPGDLSLATGRIADPTLWQSTKYYGELVGIHGLDAAQWGVGGWAAYNALAPDGTSTEGGR